jgi:hypothetical protein
MIHPVNLEIVIPTFSGADLGCFGCNILMGRSGLKAASRKACEEEYPEEWRKMVSAISLWVKDLSRLYRHRLRIRIIAAGSPLGIWKQIRHCVFKTPAFIIDRKKTYAGWDSKALEALIDERMLSSR